MSTRNMFKRKGASAVADDDTVTSGRSIMSVSDRIMGRMRRNMTLSRVQSERGRSSVWTRRGHGDGDVDGDGEYGTDSRRKRSGSVGLSRRVTGGSAREMMGNLGRVEKSSSGDEIETRREGFSDRRDVLNVEDDEESNPAEYSLPELRSMTEKEIRSAMIDAGVSEREIKKEEDDTHFKDVAVKEDANGRRGAGSSTLTERERKNRLVALFVNSGRVRLVSSKARARAKAREEKKNTMAAYATTDTGTETQQGQNQEQEQVAWAWADKDGSTADLRSESGDGRKGTNSATGMFEEGGEGITHSSWKERSWDTFKSGNLEVDATSVGDDGEHHSGDIKAKSYNNVGNDSTNKNDGDGTASLASSEQGRASSTAPSFKKKKRKKQNVADDDAQSTTTSGTAASKGRKSKLEKIVELQTENSTTRKENKSLRKTMKKLLLQLEYAEKQRKHLMERNELKNKMKEMGGEEKVEGGEGGASTSDDGGAMNDAPLLSDQRPKVEEGEELSRAADAAKEDQITEDASHQEVASESTTDGTSDENSAGSSLLNMTKVEPLLRREKSLHRQTSVRLDAEIQGLQREVQGLQRELNIGFEAAEESKRRIGELRSGNSSLKRELRQATARIAGMAKEAAARDQLIETFAKVLLQQSRESTVVGMEVGVGSNGGNGAVDGGERKASEDEKVDPIVPEAVSDYAIAGPLKSL